MYPDLFTLPGGWGIKTYGFCMMVGFLSAVWMSMKRAERVKADPDVVLDMGFLALVFGVAGARAFFVIHYWESLFADQPNPLWAVIDITQGGLEFLGGFLGAAAAIFVYGMIKRVSVRMYMDILAPGVMWGLAFGRIGCFFNGCCWGGLCTVDHTHEAKYVWAVEFPYGSPAFARQWEDRQITVPAELTPTASDRLPFDDMLVSQHALNMPVEARERPRQEFRTLAEEYKKAKEADPEGKTEKTQSIEKDLKKARADLIAHEVKLQSLEMVLRMPSRVVPTRRISVSELQDIAAKYHTLPVQPTQLFSSIHAFILSGLLSAMFYIRKRHGVVTASIFLFYPIPRMLLESIRADNPGDVVGLTASQAVSLVMLAGGIIAMIILYKFMPERSPLAVPYVPKEEESK